MNNYPLDGRVLVAQHLPADAVHPRTFVGADRPFKKIPWKLITRAQQAAPTTAKVARSALRRLVRREQKGAAKIAAAGIEYELPTGYKVLKAQQASQAAVERAPAEKLIGGFKRDADAVLGSAAVSAKKPRPSDAAPATLPSTSAVKPPTPAATTTKLSTPAAMAKPATPAAAAAVVKPATPAAIAKSTTPAAATAKPTTPAAVAKPPTPAAVAVKSTTPA